MLCRNCHIHLQRDFPYCLRCGTLRRGADLDGLCAPQLVYRVAANGMREQRATLEADTTRVGREPDNDVVLDDVSVSRHHVTITRTTSGFTAEDHRSFNGTTLVSATGEEQELEATVPVALTDHATLHVGDVAVRFEQPRPGAIGGRTQVKDIAGTVLGVTADGEAEAPTATEPLDATPRRRSGWALKQIDAQRWVLRNTRTNAYLSLDERDVFLWNRLDGENSIRDLLFAYLEEYGELALPRIESTVRSLHEAGLVRGLPGDVEETTFWQRFGRAVVKNLIRVELSIKRLDGIAEKLYQGFGWWFFTRPAVILVWLLALGGLAAFVTASFEKQLFDFAGAGIVGLLATLVGYVVATAVHELAHALAVKSYGRRVNRGGFLLMMGMPFAFVDTSDMWFGTSWSRIVVAVSGPLTTLGLAGGASIVALTAPSPVAAGIAYTLAAGLYLNTLFNLIPLVPLDGYQALADALRTPRLKEEAKAYFGKGFWGDLKARRRPGPKQLGLLIFGALSFVCLWAMIGMSVLMWNSRVGNFARDHVPQPWLTVLVVVVVALIIFPVWFPRVRTLVRRIKVRRADRTNRNAAAAPPTPAAPAVEVPALEAAAEPAPPPQARRPLESTFAAAPDLEPDPEPDPWPSGDTLAPGPLATTVRGGPLTPAQAVEVIAGIADVLDVVHRIGRAHGGVRLSGVTVTPDGGIDLADAPGGGAMEAGELDYTAPEVFDGHTGPPADVYALGALLAHLLTGQRPYPVTGLPALMRAHLTQPPPAPGAVRADLAPEIDVVVAQAMAKDPTRRPGRAREVVDAAAAALGVTPRGTTSGPPDPSHERPEPPVPTGPPAPAATDRTYVPPRPPSRPAATDRTYIPSRPAGTDRTYIPRKRPSPPPPEPTDRTYIPRM